MATKYDIIVVGAGPAGLMAAKTCAEKNLRVALIERRKEITKWTRADCMMFYGLEGDFVGEDIKVELGKVIFPKNGFEVKYSGALYPLYHWRVLSPGGHRIDFSSDKPIAAVFNKEVLLRDLLGDVEKLGVDIIAGSPGIKAENTSSGARVLISTSGKEIWLEAKKLVAADGVNSKITESVGLNKDRPPMGTFKVVQYMLEGVENPYPNSWVQFYGKSISPFAPPHFLQTVHGEDLHKLGALQPAPGNPEGDLQFIMEKSCFSSWFKKAKIAYKMGVGIKPMMPIAKPVKDNVIAIGDAAAFVEVENQGALMCGYCAGNALIQELAGNDGVKNYLDWWQRSFEFNNPEIQQVAQGFAINPFYEDDEIDYLISLAEKETLEGSINQYKIPKMLWDAILKHKDRIQQERPELSQKIDGIHQMTTQDAFTVDQKQ